MDIIVRKPTEAERKEAAAWPVWEKGVSSFPWTYGDRETCLLLEGEVVVKTPSGEVPFSAGDYVVFPAGLSCTWTIRRAVRKHYRFG